MFEIGPMLRDVLLALINVGVGWLVYRNGKHIEQRSTQHAAQLEAVQRRLSVIESHTTKISGK